ncbi:MAG: hypothetical protein Kow009_14010 [Spirochaetales bacterium]
MEGRLGYLSQQLTQAVKDFTGSLEIDLSCLDARTADAVKNGHIQKFEFCIELLWKTIKAFLYEIHGFDLASPKSVIKKYFELGYLDYPTLEQLLEAVDLRNSFSHVYKKEMFEEVYPKVKEMAPLFGRVASNLRH